MKVRYGRLLSTPGSFVQGLPLRVRLHPVRSAFLLIFVYAAFCSLWIWLSGRIAADDADSVGALERIELVKGLVFVLLTAMGFGAVCLWYLKVIARQETQLLDQERALLAAERASMAGIFAASTCHDANNLVQVIRGNIDLVLADTTVDERLRALLRQADDGCQRISRMFSRLIALSRTSLPGKTEDFELHAVLESVVGLARRHQTLKPHRITLETPDFLPVRGNPQLLSRTMLNLVLNAGEAMKTPGSILVQARESGEGVVIDVHDNGPGIPDEDKLRIVEAFFTTKEGGTGLGLLSLTSCAREHGGSFEILDSPLGGAQFRLHLPAVRAGACLAPA